MREKADDRVLEPHPEAMLANKRGLRSARLNRSHTARLTLLGPRNKGICSFFVVWVPLAPLFFGNKRRNRHTHQQRLHPALTRGEGVTNFKSTFLHP